jgi:hypothetical protein
MALVAYDIMKKKKMRNSPTREKMYENCLEEPLLNNASDILEDCYATIGDENKIYCNNSISTTRYNALNFLPKSIFEQFRRLANVFFLLMSALMLLGKFIILVLIILNIVA